jgi:membrane-associated phospholipid phosphatase
MMARKRVWSLMTAIVFVVGCSDAPSSPGLASEATAAEWQTWVLSSASEVRPTPPPATGSAQSIQEIDEILRLQTARTAVTDSLVRYWNVLPTQRWHEQTLDLLEFYWALLPDVRTATPVRSARIFSLVNVAMYDAMIAAWDAKYAYSRPAPAVADSRVRGLVSVGNVPSYPSEHAAAAAAAASVLTFLFPLEDTLRFQRLMREAGDSRIVAGAAYRSDVEAGYAIGRAVAAKVVARARGDGSDAVWTGTAPTATWVWQPTPPRRVKVPFDPVAGSWRTWVIASGSAYRPTPPPLPGSSHFQTDLDELRRIASSRTIEQADTVRYWATDAPSSRWEVFMETELAAHHFGPVHAARAMALASTAMADALIACWDAKFFYWLQRPISADTTLRTAISTPPFPSYPSGHSTQSAAAAEIFAYLFPDRAEYYRARADEASRSRVLAGIHYRFDIETGEALGRTIGGAAVDRARRDGADLSTGR